MRHCGESLSEQTNSQYGIISLLQSFLVMVHSLIKHVKLYMHLDISSLCR